MSQFFKIHPVNPQKRLVARCADILRAGGLVVYPTDSCYAFGCRIGDKSSMEAIRRIRQTGRDHDFTLVCRDLSEIAAYALIDNAGYRLLKSLTPGPYTFILPATRDVPRRLRNPKRKSIGIRVPDHPVAQALLSELGEPVMSSTLLLPDQTLPMTDPEEIRARLEHDVQAVIDGGYCGVEPSTVLDMTSGHLEVRRAGKGPVDFLSGP